MDASEVEDGEITDSGDEEVGQIKASDDNSSKSSSYVAPDPLPRPTNPAMSYRAPQEPCPRAHTFRESPRFGGDDSDDADSELSDDGAYISGKKRKVHHPTTNGSSSSSSHHHRRQHTAVAKTRKKMSIWQDVLYEDSISNKIKSSGNLRSREDTVVERGVESYIPSGDSRTVDVDEFDAELSEAAARIQADQLWNVNDDGESDNHNVKKRTGHKNSIKNRMDLRAVKGHTRGGGDYSYNDYYEETPTEVCAEDDERKIARYIARNLNEPKLELIQRVVRYTSRQKALDLFNRTMDVEASGGMKTMLRSSFSRATINGDLMVVFGSSHSETEAGDMRRTPGGVFLQLLKADKEVTKETVKEIFAVERENQKFTKKQFIKDRQFRKRKYCNRNQTTDSLYPSASFDVVDDTDLMGEEPDIEIGVGS